jgi:hypothetical protein
MRSNKSRVTGLRLPNKSNGWRGTTEP